MKAPAPIRDRSGISADTIIPCKDQPPSTKRMCICQAKVDTKKRQILEAQFGFVLNWAFIAQSGRRPPVIEIIHILVKQPWNVISSLQAEVKV